MEKKNQVGFQFVIPGMRIPRLWFLVGSATVCAQGQDVCQACSPVLPMHSTKPNPSHQLCSNFTSTTGWINTQTSFIDLLGFGRRQ